jgi:hypothetical protein
MTKEEALRALLVEAQYFESVHEYDLAGRADDEPVEIVVTVKALKDLSNAITDALHAA